ncbi:hypothetical protein PInf_009790 [Phytophthora infestans]|nr:hypothetical protein PInf_009790 [Phytophthora infestans]
MDVLIGVDTKKFKNLWSQLAKDGWKARPPTGLNVGHTYVKPGVKGKLRKERVNADYFCEPAVNEFPVPVGRPPIGKQAAYTAAQRQIPTAAPERDEHSDLGGQSGGVTPAAAAQGSDGVTPVATEQGGGHGGVSPVATEQCHRSGRSSPSGTEQARRADHSNSSCTEAIASDDDSIIDVSEEAKTDDGPDDLTAFDRDNFMDAMRAENLFPPPALDDINVGSEAFSVSDDSDEEDSAFCDFDPDLEEYMDEVESDSDFEDEGEAFQQDDDEMKGLEWELTAQANDPNKRVEDLRDIVDRLKRQKPIRDDQGQTADKAFKVRPILQVKEKTFRRGYRLGPVVSFDEDTIPNRSQYNPIRVYNKDKPHKYGTKCYMTCCAETGYCARVEVYLGAKPDKRKKQG